MKSSKRKKLETEGWKVGSAREFLGRAQEELDAVNLKLTLGASLNEEIESWEAASDEDSLNLEGGLEVE